MWKMLSRGGDGGGWHTKRRLVGFINRSKVIIRKRFFHLLCKFSYEAGIVLSEIYEASRKDEIYEASRKDETKLKMEKTVPLLLETLSHNSIWFAEVDGSRLDETVGFC